MTLLSVVTPEGPKLAVKLSSGILVLDDEVRGRIPGLDSLPRTLMGALSEPEGLGAVRRCVALLAGSAETFQDLVLPEEEVRIGLPFLPRNIICIGLNYKDHADEGGAQVPNCPVLFAKLQSSIIGPNEPILLPPDTEQVDYEAELAVIIGRRCRLVSAGEALDYVAGYTCLNDVSARDFQRADGQWVRAKSQDTFGPMGPFLVTADEIPDPQTLGIRCWVNGQQLQNSNTSKMIVPISELIAFVSRGITLAPGDVISTGTPSGVGFARKPPIFLKDGDQVVVEVDRVGRLSSPVRQVARKPACAHSLK